MRAIGAAGLIAVAGLAGAGIAAPVASAQTAVTMNYTCDFPILGDETVAITITATAPSSVTPGQSFSLTGVQSTSVISAAVATDLALIESSISGTVTTFDTNATNATPATVNGAATPISFGPVPVTSGDPITIVAPATPETVGPFTAGSSGTVTITPGDISLVTALGGTNYTVPCTTPSPLPSGSSISIPISSASEPIGTIGGLGLAAAVGAGFVYRQRRIRTARAAGGAQA